MADYDNGRAVSVIRFLNDQYGETMNRLGLVIEEAELDEIRVKNPPSTFAGFMENQGYCNRHKFDTYKPCDVLAFVVMAHHKLFGGFMNRDIRDEMEMMG